MTNLTKWQQIKKQAEASKFRDIEIAGFISRGSLIVLQTHGENFELMTTEEKLNTVEYMIKSLEFLKSQILMESEIVKKGNIS